MNSKVSLRGLLLGALFGLLSTLSPLPALAVDVNEVDKLLRAEGAVGWVHGAVGERDLFVFSYRNPNDFFDAIQMSLLTQNEAVRATLASLSRHDKVRLKGEVIKNPSPQPHVLVTSVEIVEKWNPATTPPPYEHEGVPEELKSVSSAVFLVHAIAGDGRILVLEYRDQIVPVFVRKPELVRDLYRNDVVELQIRAQSEPDRPLHLRLNEQATEPVKVLQKVLQMHEQPAMIEGSLILFQKSPDIRFNVFAVQEKLANGLSRQYTLVNFDDPNAFREIREKLQKEWDKHPGEFVNGRNKLVSTKIRIRATGVFNVVDPNQANVQILLKDASSIDFL